MMQIFMFGLGVAMLVMIVGIGLLVVKDVMELIDLVHDTNNPTNGPLHRGGGQEDWAREALPEW